VGRIALERTASPALPPLPEKPSIAVLPFQNLSGDPEQEYFVDGMVQEIITTLSRIRWLFVIARNSSFTYKDQAVDVKQVGRELGVLCAARQCTQGWRRAHHRAIDRGDDGAHIRLSASTVARRSLRPSGQGGVECGRRDEPAPQAAETACLPPARPTISPRTISICGPMQCSCRRRDKSPRRFVCWNGRSRAIRVTGLHLLLLPSAVFACSMTIGAKIGKPIASRAPISRGEPWS
jgi:hypothetical protein